jgi:hypothetical protein
MAFMAFMDESNGRGRTDAFNFITREEETDGLDTVGCSARAGSRCCTGSGRLPRGCASGRRVLARRVRRGAWSLLDGTRRGAGAWARVYGWGGSAPVLRSASSMAAVSRKERREERERPGGGGGWEAGSGLGKERRRRL